MPAARQVTTPDNYREVGLEVYLEHSIKVTIFSCAELVSVSHQKI